MIGLADLFGVMALAWPGTTATVHHGGLGAYSQEMVSYVTNQAWFAIAVSAPFVAFGVKGINGSQAQTNGRWSWYLPELYPAA